MLRLRRMAMVNGSTDGENEQSSDASTDDKTIDGESTVSFYYPRKFARNDIIIQELLQLWPWIGSENPSLEPGKIERRLIRLQKVLTIGRGDNVSIHSDDDRISRMHAKLTYKDGVVKLKDRSKNGTYLNWGGQWWRIKSGQPIALQSGDLFMCPPLIFLYRTRRV